MTRKTKQILSTIIVVIAVGLLAVVVFGRLGGDEDTWLCVNGSWVKHGNPGAAAPTTGCGDADINSPQAIGGPSITNYQECVDAGYPVQESYPPKCAVPGGDTFTQDIGNELEKSDMIRLDEPRPNTSISSPLTISGEARGSWYFEAEFPVTLLDADGELVAHATARAQSDWMTTDFIPFTAEITFTPPASDTGVLILSKENPSGLPELSDELVVPVMYTDLTIDNTPSE